MNRNTIKVVILIVILLIILSVGTRAHKMKEVSGDPLSKPIRVLFVGNSLTYINDIPALVKELGKADSILVEYKTIAKPDYGLDDHLNEGVVQKEINKGKYDYVVVQQGPSALPESQAVLISSVQKYKTLCDRAKTKLALYMVWPSRSRIFDLDNVIYSYSNAGKKNNAIICAAGLAWKKTWAVDPGITLYGSDGFHPELAGSLLAALVIYGTLTGNNDFNRQYAQNRSWSAEIKPAIFEVLKKSAIETIQTKF